MGRMDWTSLLLPAALLMGVAWAVPYALGRLVPAGLPGVALNAAASTLVVGAAAAALFAWLYGPAAAAVREAAPGHFVALAAKASLLWGPIVALTVTRRGA